MDGKDVMRSNRFSGYNHNIENTKNLESSFASLSFAQPSFFDRMEHEKQIESMGSYPNPALSHTSVGSGPSNTLTSLSTAAETSSQNANNVKSSNEISNYYWGIDNRDSEFVLPGTAGTLTANSIMDSANITRISDCNTTFGSSAGNVDSSDSLKLELQLKETQIESLESEIQKLKATFNQGVKYKQNKIQMEQIPNEIDSVVEIPANLEMIFLRLSSSLRKKEEELEETKQRLESIITAIALNPSNSVTKFGRYDEEALAHKTIVRLEMLTKENREMAKMLGYGRSKEVQIELDLLKKENSELKEKISTLKKQLQN